MAMGTAILGNNGNGNIGNNNGNGNLGSNNGNGNPSSNNGNGNSGNGKGNGSSLNGVNGNLSNAVGLRPLMVAGNSGVVANPFVGPTTMGGVVPLLPGQGLLPMSGPVIAPATQALVPVTAATLLGGR
jgi:hypothetical protein